MTTMGYLILPSDEAQRKTNATVSGADQRITLVNNVGDH